MKMHLNAPECRFNLKCTFKLCQFTHTTKKGEEVAHRQEVETLNEGVVENRRHLLPAIISTDRTIAHKELMKPLEDAEAVEMNVENDYGVLGSESFLADMESMEGVVDEESDSEDNGSFIGGVEEDYETPDSDDESSEDEDELRRRMHKMLTEWV